MSAVPGSLDYHAFLASFESSTYTQLRPAQATVLEAYAASFATHEDVGIELPTGAGKSLIALLIAEAWRRDGYSTVILTANKALATKMETDGTALGIPVVRLEGPGRDISSSSVRRISRKQAVGVMNYWVYFNQNPVIDHADLVVLDDVHLADGALQSLFSLSITRREHPVLFERIADFLAREVSNYPAVRHAAAGDDDPTAPTDLLAPHDHLRLIPSIGALIAGAVEGGPDDLRYRFERVRDRLERLLFYITADEMLLRPDVWPLQDIDAYAKSTQRLYLSATLGSANDLQRRLGCKPVSLVDVATEDSEPLGRRFIVLGEGESEDMHRITSHVAMNGKALWLSRSHALADRWAADLREKGAGPVWRLSTTGAELEIFAAAAAGHLVAAGRYDGIDLPGDTCRTVVVTELPRAVGLQETFLSEQLRDASFLVERVNARVVQALGRANRDDSDYAVYVLADPRFGAHLRRESNRASLPPRVNAEIDVAQDRATENPDLVLAAMQAFLAGHFETEDAAVAEALAYTPPTPVARPEIPAADEVEGWQRLWLGDAAKAQKHFEAWAAACEAVGLREQAAFAFVCCAHASLVAPDSGSRARARAFIERARGAGGVRSTWFNALAASLERDTGTVSLVTAGEAADAVLDAFDRAAAASGGRTGRFAARQQTVSDKLRSGSHAAFQEGLQELAALLGIHSIRPKGTGATDTRWEWAEAGRRQLLTIEVKVEHEDHNALTVSNVDQANGQLTAARKEFEPRGVVCRGAIVSHLAPDATAAGRLGPVVCITRDAIVALWERVSGLYLTYLGHWTPDDADTRAAAVAAVAGRMPADHWLTVALDNAGPLGPNELLAGWP